MEEWDQRQRTAAKCAARRARRARSPRYTAPIRDEVASGKAVVARHTAGISDRRGSAACTSLHGFMRWRRSRSRALSCAHLQQPHSPQTRLRISHRRKSTTISKYNSTGQQMGCHDINHAVPGLLDEGHGSLSFCVTKRAELLRHKIVLRFPTRTSRVPTTPLKTILSFRKVARCSSPPPMDQTCCTTNG